MSTHYTFLVIPYSVMEVMLKSVPKSLLEGRGITKNVYTQSTLVLVQLDEGL